MRPLRPALGSRALSQELQPMLDTSCGRTQVWLDPGRDRQQEPSSGIERPPSQDSQCLCPGTTEILMHAGRCTWWSPHLAPRGVLTHPGLRPRPAVSSISRCRAAISCSQTMGQPGPGPQGKPRLNSTL